MNLENLIWADGRSNPSGIGTKIYVALKSEVASFPAFATDPASAASAVTLDGDIVMKASKIFKEIYSTEGKGKVSFTPEGEKDGKIFKTTGTFKFPDLSDEAIASASAMLNSNCVFIVPTRVGNNGGKFKWIMIGGGLYDTESSISGDTGDKAGSEKGMTIEISSYDEIPLKRYIGAVPLEGGAYDCDTGVFTASE